MTIQEAIKAAGPGGRGCNDKWRLKFEIDKDGQIFFRGPEPISHKAFIDDTWQVVTPEPEIEVGDVVKGRLYCSGKGACKITAINATQATLEHQLSKCLCFSPKDSLTLIRKGPKRHVFEGVVIRKNGLPVRVHDWERIIDGLLSLADNGKVYKMTLEEVDDANRT